MLTKALQRFLIILASSMVVSRFEKVVSFLLEFWMSLFLLLFVHCPHFFFVVFRAFDTLETVIRDFPSLGATYDKCELESEFFWVLDERLNLISVIFPM